MNNVEFQDLFGEFQQCYGRRYTDKQMSRIWEIVRMLNAPLFGRLLEDVMNHEQKLPTVGRLLSYFYDHANRARLIERDAAIDALRDSGKNCQWCNYTGMVNTEDAKGHRHAWVCCCCQAAEIMGFHKDITAKGFHGKMNADALGHRVLTYPTTFTPRDKKLNVASLFRAVATADKLIEKYKALPDAEKMDAIEADLRKAPDNENRSMVIEALIKFLGDEKITYTRIAKNASREQKGLSNAGKEETGVDIPDKEENASEAKFSAPGKRYPKSYSELSHPERDHGVEESYPGDDEIPF